MDNARRIDISLLDNELKSLIANGLNIIPISYYDILNNINSSNSCYSLSNGKIYKWDSDSWVFITEYSSGIVYDDILEKPLEFKPTNHNHSIDDVLNLHDTLVGLSQQDYEIADALNDRITNLAIDYSNSLDSFLTEITTHLSNKVNIEPGKTLSSNDFTDELKASVILNNTSLDTLKQFLLSIISDKINNSTFYGHVDNKSMHLSSEERDSISNSKKKTYIHSQSQSLAEWNIKHNLDEFPSVTIVDSGGSYVIGDVVYIDKNHIKVIFTAEFSGKAYLN